MNTQTVLLIASLCALTFGSCGHKEKDHGLVTADTIPVKIILLQQQQNTPEVHTSGTLTTEDETVLSFKTGGIVKQVLVKEGDAVRAGQLLAVLNLTEINAQTAQSGIALEKATRDYERAQRLYKDSVATLEQLQNAKTALDIARQQNSAAGFNRSYSEIRAAQNGFVLHKYVNDGQLVNAGTLVLQVNGAASASWVLKAGLSDAEWSSVKVGDKAIIETETLPGRQVEAVVSRRAEGIDPATGTFPVVLKLKEKLPQSVASGLFGKATIFPVVSTSSWSIPYDAMLDGDAGTGYVFVTSDMKTAQKRKISIADIANNKVLVSSGLEDARALIISGSPYLDDHSPITINR